jgi:putative transposase
MSKNASRTKKNQEPSAGAQRTLRLASVIRRDLYAFIIQEGLKALDEVLRQDQERLCGPAHAKGAPGSPQRWGRTSGRLVMAGRRVVVDKPRVRQKGREVALPSWAQFADEDPLNERTAEQLILGVSTRGYDRSVEPVPEELTPHGASKSAASRRFVAKTQQRLEQWLERDLSEMHIVAVMLDAIQVDEHAVVVALGIDESGAKHALGLWLGATENSAVCGALLDNLIERGLDPQLGYLFIIDGSKALRKAIRERFGRRALVQRCQEHKRRNVLGHLPERLHPSVAKTMRDAYRSRSKATAKRRLLQLASQLMSDHPDAAGSLKEGVDETLTLKDLGLPPPLERTLSTTNSIENVNSNIRRTLRRVKRWRDGGMIKRWVAAALVEAERGFRRLRGFKGMPGLVAFVRSTEQKHRVDSDEEAA